MSQEQFYQRGYGYQDPCELEEEQEDFRFMEELDTEMEEEAIEATVRQFEINYCM